MLKKKRERQECSNLFFFVRLFHFVEVRINLRLFLPHQNVEIGLPAAVQLGPARVLELGAGRDRSVAQQGTGGGVRVGGAGSP